MITATGQDARAGRARPAAVLLDLDGTLVDSDAAVLRAWQRFCAEYRVDLAEVMRVHAGRPALETVRLVAPWLGERAGAVAAARQLAWQYDDLVDVQPIAGADRLVATMAAAHLPWAVVTSGDRRLASARLAVAGLTPPALVTAEDVTAPKPHPEGYLRAARALGVPPRRCLVVEDSPAGVEAGRAAGMLVAGVRGVAADLAIDGLARLADYLWASTGDTGGGAAGAGRRVDRAARGGSRW